MQDVYTILIEDKNNCLRKIAGDCGKCHSLSTNPRGTALGGNNYYATSRFYLLNLTKSIALIITLNCTTGEDHSTDRRCSK